MKKYIILLIFSILVTPIVSSLPYFFTGQNQFHSGDGSYQSGTQVTSIVKSTGTVVYPPIVGDIDNDGIAEVVLISSGVLRVYNDATLSSVTLVQTNFTDTSPPILADVDKDNELEIIVANQSTSSNTLSNSISIAIVDYSSNSSQIQVKHLSNDVGGDYNSGEVSIQCANAGDCALFYISSFFASGDINHLGSLWFNSSQINDRTILYNTSLTVTMCFPTIRHVSISDGNLDGNRDYALSMVREIVTSTFSDESFVLINADVEESGSTVYFTTVVDEGVNFGNPASCDDTAGINMKRSLSGLIQGLTSTTGGDYDDLFWNAHMVTSADDFKLFSYKASTGVKDDDYPEVANIEGELLSNVMMFNAIPGASPKACVLGHDDANDELNMLCAPMNELDLVDNAQFHYGFSPTIARVVQSYNNHQMHSISSEMNPSDISTPSGSGSVDELVWGLGTFQLDYSQGGCSSLGICDMSRDFTNSRYINTNQSGIMVVADIKNVGSSQLLFQQPSSFTFIDNNFQNKAGSLSIEIDPCISQSGTPVNWKINTSVGVTITVSDSQGDDHNVTVSLYQGTTSERSESVTVDGTSGANTFEFIANVTGSNKKLVVTARDLVGGLSSTQTRFFSVASQGVERGDCTTDISVDEEGETEVEEEEDEEIEEVSKTIVRQRTGITAIFNSNSGVFPIGERNGFLLVLLIANIVILGSIVQGRLGTEGLVHYGAGFNIIAVLFGIGLGVFDGFDLLIIAIIAVIGVTFMLSKRATS